MLRKTQNEVLNETTRSLSHRARGGKKNEVTARDVYGRDGEMAYTRRTRGTRARLHFAAPSPTAKKKRKSFVQFRLCGAHTNISLHSHEGVNNVAASERGRLTGKVCKGEKV